MIKIILLDDFTAGVERDLDTYNFLRRYVTGVKLIATIRCFVNFV